MLTTSSNLYGGNAGDRRRSQRGTPWPQPRSWTVEIYFLSPSPTESFAKKALVVSANTPLHRSAQCAVRNPKRTGNAVCRIRPPPCSRQRREKYTKIFLSRERRRRRDAIAKRLRHLLPVHAHARANQHTRTINTLKHIHQNTHTKDRINI